MYVKKYGNQVYGAALTKAEQKAMDIEIRKQCAEFEKSHVKELASLILWQLHTEFGFGHDRMKRFYSTFRQNIDELLERYELEDTDDVWLCTRQLQNYGVDLNEWDKE